MKKSKTALVTGGAKRIGKSFSEYLASKGWNVIVHANSSLSEAYDLVEKLGESYPEQNFEVVQLDLNYWKQVEHLLLNLKEIGFEIDLLINNASVFEQSSLLDSDDELIERQFGVNFFAPFKLTQAYVKSYDKGIVINILDTKIAKNEFDRAAYLISKKSLAEFTKMAALEFAPHFRVNAIAPGPVLPAANSAEGYFEEVIATTPLKKSVALDELNAALEFLIHANSTTGQVVFCDSGAHLR